MTARLAIVIAFLSTCGCALSHDILLDGAAATVLAPCSAATPGPGRDCGWMLAGTFACTPGGPVSVGCDIGCGLGSCTGDSMIRVCAGTSACFGADAIGSDDDSPCGGGLCSTVRDAPCPASGSITVMTGPFSSGQPYACNIAVR